MTGKEVMDKATKSLQDTLKPIYANWADALMREAYNAGRREALEEAAKACHVKSDEYHAAYKRSPVDDPRRGNAYVEGMSDGCSNCADAIRALSQKDPQ